MKLNPLLHVVVASLLVACVSCNSVGERPAGSTSNNLLASVPPTTAPADAFRTARLSKDVYFLASDELEGRGIGTRGLDTAADYIAERFRTLGLRTLPGYADYFQPFTMNAAASVDPTSSLTVGDTSFELDRQFRPPGISADGSFAAPLVFAGYGVTNAERDYDDYANLDVTGKVVLVLRYEPHTAEGRSRFTDSGDWSDGASLNTKADLAAERGAVAILLVNPPKHHEGDSLLPVSRGGRKSPIPFVHVKREVAEALLTRGGSERTLEQLQTEIDAAAKPQSFALNDAAPVRGKVAIERKRVPVRNVLAYLPGEREDEYVVVGAHYDHVGRGGRNSAAPGASQIHNGADDNASGTAAMLELAERMTRAAGAPPPKRSIIFAAFTGEEEGLVGSQRFVDNPPVPLDRVVAMLNMDMVGRIRNNVLYVGGEGTAAAFGPMLKEVDAASPLNVSIMGRGGRGPSDHQSFAMKKVPVLFLFSGLHPDYHRPTDDADKVNYQGINDVIDFARQVVARLAEMPRQQYVSTYDSQRTPLGGTGSRGGGPRATLGVVPDYGTDESTTGVRITGTTPGTPAEKAGMKEGDVLVRINQTKIQNLQELSEFLSRARPGDEVKLGVERDKQLIELTTKLEARRE